MSALRTFANSTGAVNTSVLTFMASECTFGWAAQQASADDELVSNHVAGVPLSQPSAPAVCVWCMSIWSCMSEAQPVRLAWQSAAALVQSMAV